MTQPPLKTAPEPSVSVREYHQRTKHRMDGYARGPDTLDWDQQPDPFRRFEGTRQIQLPLNAAQITRPYSELWQTRGKTRIDIDLNDLASLLELSMALSAWKQLGPARWSMRCNPSSGNLHPTECYLICQGVKNLDDGIYHYRADLHALELRASLNSTLNAGLGDRADSTHVPLILIGLSSIHWREAWKYGERAYRYCQLDTGHALAAIGFASTTLNLSCSPVPLTDSQLTRLLGLDQLGNSEAEAEYPDCLLQIQPQPLGSHNLLPASGDKPKVTNNPMPDMAQRLDRLIEAASQRDWQGQANALDPQHLYHWPLVDQVSALCHRSQTLVSTPPSSHTAESSGQGLSESAPTDWQFPPPLANATGLSASTIIRQRRSAQGFDASSPLPQAQLFEMLDHCLPRSSAPWNPLEQAPRIHLVLFVHRVQGLKPGLYALPRTAPGLSLMKSAMNPEFLWRKLHQAPEHLPLYQLTEGKTARYAVRLCCQQTIAGSSAFSLGMLAEFDQTLAYGDWHYRPLHWEAGAIGQSLYLDAEAVGFRGTGIGCFLDDSIHEFLGITDTQLQSIYHFTIGKPLADPRIQIWPPYSHRR